MSNQAATLRRTTAAEGTGTTPAAVGEAVGPVATPVISSAAGRLTGTSTAPGVVQVSSGKLPA